MDNKTKKYLFYIGIFLLIVFFTFSLMNKENKIEKEEVENYIVVHIAGAVKNPGVYRLLEGSRVIDGIRSAGGALPSADLDKLNLASYLEDGAKIYVPEKILPTQNINGNSEVKKASNSGNKKININTASKEELESLPGIGPSLAQRIIEYRESNGYFSSLDDLEKVKGIGPKKIEQIKDYIEW